MKLVDYSVNKFIDLLSSNEAVPGGGGASALVGALGCALGIMVTNLTIGKEKYKNFDADNIRIKQDISKIRDRLLDLIQEDADNFRPLSKAYSLPSSTPNEKIRKEKQLELCSIKACEAPIEIIKLSIKSLALLEELVGTGSILALSDIGVAAEMIRSAISGGWINVLINLKYIKKDRSFLDNCKKVIYPQVNRAKEKASSISNIIQHKIMQ